MNRQQSGQALLEWAAAALVLLLFALAMLAEADVVGEQMAVRAAASQAAFAAARAPSADAAQEAGQQAAREAVASSQIKNLQIMVDTGGFERGGTLTAEVTGCVSLDPFPFVSRLMGSCVQLRWTAHALIEPYRSRAA